MSILKQLVHNKISGQSIIEVLAGLIILIPIALALLDAGVLVMAGTVTGNMSKQAARAAANAPDTGSAQTAVSNTLQQFPPSAIYQNPTLKLTRYDSGSFDGVATVTATVTVNLPVSVPMFNIGPSVPITTQASEPIVSVPPPP